MRLITVIALALAIAAPAQAQASRIAAQLKNAAGPQVLVAAHRGGHLVAPENSIAAIEDAIAIGVDIVEIDVRLTRDGVPILMHDASVDRTTTGTGKVKDLSYADILKLRLRSPGGAATDISVPTLSAALSTAKDRIMVDLDLKADDVEPILSRVIEAAMLDQVLFFNGDYPHLEKFRAIRPDFLPMPRAHSLTEAQTAAQTFRPEVIHIDPSFYDDAVHAAAMTSDSRMWINALGQADVLIAQGKPKDGVDPLLAHGASILQTDQPAALIAYLKSINRR